ncbi:MAG: hypothetical protein KDA20_04865 [Phycisphaerales bacterium]|nr:hypothetical protein [Phycisphaerales bacterium]
MMIGGLALLCWTMAQPPAGSDPMPAAPEPNVVGIALHHRDPAVDALLDRLEVADAGMTDLTGALVYTRVNVILEDIQTRIGSLKFVVLPPKEAGRRPRRVFLAHFTQYIDPHTKRDEDEQWGFDGQWLIERNAREKTRIARQMARPGEDVDPLRLGEGPLPIPLGQRKAEILSRYDVSQRDVKEGLEASEAVNFRAYVNDAVQLHLKPLRPDESFDEVRLWYRDDAQGRLLPILARSARFDREGEETDVVYVQLVNVKINQGLTLDDVAVAPAGQDWREKIEALPAQVVGEAAQGDKP